MGTNLSPQVFNGGTFDVVSYFADPTGSADSSTAVQAAMTAAQTYAASNGRATVKFPAGKYKLNSTVKVIGGNVTIDAYGAYIFAGSNNDLFRDWTSQDSSYTLNGSGLTILGGTWDLKGQNWGSGSNSTLNATGFSGFTLSNSSNITFRDVTVRNVYDYHAIDLNSCRDVMIQGCRFEGFKNNFTWLQDVVTATTANITLSGLQTIDGIAVTAGQRVLVKNQTTQSQNGIYTAASGSWSRATDMTTSSQFNDVAVENATTGGTNSNKAFYQSAHNPTVGTTAIVWTDTSSNAFHNESRKYSEAIQLDCGPNSVATINVTVQGCHMGPAIDGSALGGFGKLVGSHTAPSSHYQNVRIVGNMIDSPSDAAIRAYQWDGSVVQGNTITSSVNQTCVWMDTCAGTTIQGNVIVQGGTSGVIEGGTKNGGTGTTLQDNAHCIKVTNTTDCSVIGNQCAGNDASGIGIQMQGATRTRISDNSVYQVGTYGIYISSTSVDCAVTGNTVVGANRRGLSDTGAIAVSGSSNLDNYITSNMIRKFGSGSEATNAIEIEGTGPTTIIGDNDFGSDWGTGWQWITYKPTGVNVKTTIRGSNTAERTTTLGLTSSNQTVVTLSNVPAGSYIVTAYMPVDTTGTTTILSRISGPTATLDVECWRSRSSTGNPLSTMGTDATISSALGAGGTAWHYRGSLISTTTGDVTLGMTMSSGGTATVRAGAWVKLERVS